VAPEALPAHYDHGDTLGPCEESARDPVTTAESAETVQPDPVTEEPVEAAGPVPTEEETTEEAEPEESRS
jgi:hypothetical protein